LTLPFNDTIDGVLGRPLQLRRTIFIDLSMTEFTDYKFFEISCKFSSKLIPFYHDHDAVNRTFYIPCMSIFKMQTSVTSVQTELSQIEYR